MTLGRKRLWLPFLLCVLAFCVGLAPARAQPKPPSPTPSASAPAPEDPNVEPSPAADEELAPTESEPPPMEDGGEMPDPLRPFPWKSVLTENLHNKLVHFPFALGLAAAVLLLVAPRFPLYEPAARALLVAAGLFAIGAFLTGRLQRESYEDGAMQQVLTIHQYLGLSTLTTLWVGVALSFRPGLKRLMPFYALLLMALILTTGMFGGLLSHG